MAERTLLQTARLLLRPFRDDDVEDALAYRDDREFARYLPHIPQPFTRADAEAFVARNRDEPWNLFPTFAVVLADKVIGTVNLDVDPQKQTAMLGFAIARAHWGQGLGLEAARAVLDWAFPAFGLKRIWASTDGRNLRSQRLLEKLGMRCEGRLRHHDVGRDGHTDKVWYGLLRQEWEDREAAASGDVTKRAPLDLDAEGDVSVYDDLPLWSAACGQLLLDQVPLSPGSRALDVGCGTGFPLVELAQRLGAGATVCGIDPWQRGLQRAREKLIRRGVPNAALLVGRGEALPFADGGFDLVVSNLGINNFAQKAATLRECRRVCAPGAHIVLATNVRGTMAELYTAYAEALRVLGVPEERVRATVAQLVSARTTAAEVVQDLAAAGFGTARLVESSFRMRFASGRALVEHWFIRLAFLGSWIDAAQPEDPRAVLQALVQVLDDVAQAEGAVTLTIPIACVVARAT